MEAGADHTIAGNEQGSPLEVVTALGEYQYEQVRGRGRVLGFGFGFGFGLGFGLPGRSSASRCTSTSTSTAAALRHTGRPRPIWALRPWPCVLRAPAPLLTVFPLSVCVCVQVWKERKKSKNPLERLKKKDEKLEKLKKCMELLEDPEKVRKESVWEETVLEVLKMLAV